MGEREDTQARLRLRLRQAFAANAEADRRNREAVTMQASLAQATIEVLDRVTRERPVVLLVEDDPSQLDAYARPLRDECDLLKASSVEQAVEYIEEAEHIDFAVLDYRLPDGTGYDVAAHLRTKFRAIEVFVCSGYMDDGIKRMFSQLPGPFRFFEKVAPDFREKIRTAARTPPGFKPPKI